MSELIHEVEIRPAYDKRPQYGQHCVDMTFYVKGPKGAVQFVLYTGWYSGIIATPDKPWQELMVAHHPTREHLTEPLPADLGYHSPVPTYEGQSSRENCHVLPGGKCYYDGSGLNANRIFSIMVHEGGEAMWKALDQYYQETFPEEVDNHGHEPKGL